MELINDNSDLETRKYSVKAEDIDDGHLRWKKTKV